jgi:hypothetical protein
MAYSRYFGMRSFENVIRDGRFRTQAELRIGSPVVIDPDNAGKMKQAAAGEAPGQDCGLVIFEHIQNKSDALTTVYDSPYDKAPAGQYAQIMHGPGTKVWFKNHASKVLYDGRTQEAGTLLDAGLDLATLKPGDGLAVAANGKFAKAADAATTWLVVEQVNPSTGRVEARLTF